jgi:hypothetical protein
MKKYILVILLSLAACCQLRAQYSEYYYHRVGDTVEWQANNGYYSWWEFETFFQQNLSMIVNNMIGVSSDYDSAVVLMGFYTPVPLKVIGVAGVSRRGNITGGFKPAANIFQEYYYIYSADSSGLTLRSQTPWSSLDPSRKLHLKIHRSWVDWSDGVTIHDTCCWYKPVEYYLPIQEYYFDSAFYVADTFYVGGSYFGNRPAYMTGVPSSDTIKTTYYYANTKHIRGIACNTELQDPTYYDFISESCFPYGVHMKMKRDRHQWGNMPDALLPLDSIPWEDVPPDVAYPILIYPIIEVDTTVAPADACPPVSNLQVTTDGTSATVTWDGFPNYSYVELSYGLCAVPQSQWQTLEVQDISHHTFTGLASAACYQVRARAYCDTSKTETAWSAPVSFNTGADTTGGGGDDSLAIHSTLLSQLTFLAPNPASDEITISSSFSLQEVDIWTVDGVWVHHQPVTGHRATLPVDFLRPGTYIIAIRTHNGTTHKKLVISR